MGEARRRKLRGEYPSPSTPEKVSVIRSVPDALFHRSIEILGQFSLDEINKANDFYFLPTDKKYISSKDVFDYPDILVIVIANAIACGRAYFKEGALCLYEPTLEDAYSRHVLENGGSLVRVFPDYVSLLEVPIKYLDWITAMRKGIA